MALNCESCGAENPAANRYCGRCGEKLEQSATAVSGELRPALEDTGRAGQTKVSAGLSSKVTGFDAQTSRLAGNGADRRIPPSPGAIAQGHGRPSRAAELRNYNGQTPSDATEKDATEKEEAKQKGRMEALRWKEAELESRGIFLPWSTRSEANAPAAVGSSAKAGETASAGDIPNLDAIMDAVAEPHETASVAGSAALADAIMDAASGTGGRRTDRRPLASEDKEEAPTGVSDPPLPRPSDDYLPQPEAEAHEPKSHLRRNIAFAVVAAAVLLAALQWRSIRDFGLGSVLGNLRSSIQSPARNGSLEPGGEQVSAAAPAAAKRGFSQDSGPPPATGKPGTANNSPNAGRELTGQAAIQPKLHQQAAAPPRAAPGQPLTMSAPAAALPQKQPSLSAANPRPSVAASPAPVSFARNAPAPAPAAASASALGADEMNHAAHADDAEARAAWLWKAVGKGNARAQVELATMYQQGNGVLRSCDQAQILLRSAAAKGNAQAKLSLQEIELHGGCSPR